MKSIGTKLAFLILTLVAAAAASVALISGLEMESFYKDRLVDDLLRQGRQFEYLFRQPTPPGYEIVAGMAQRLNVRLTLISPTGQVLFDSDVQESRLGALENHLNRPEVQEARVHGHGVDIRHSNTIGVDMLYVARLLDSPLHGTSPECIRVAMLYADVQGAMRGIKQKAAIAGLVSLILAGIACFIVSRRIVKPIVQMAADADEIKRGNLERQIRTGGDDEIGQLAVALREMVDKLKTDIAQMRKLERMRSEFLGNVSHELRTPIFAIQGFIETLLGGAVNDPKTNVEFLRKALDHTVRLNTLLNDLIEISRIETGEMKLSFRYVDVRELLEDIFDEMKPVALQKSISIELARGQDGRVEALGDRERLRQTLTNLIDNAVKYTDPGGRVSIGFNNEPGQVRIFVVDTGCGIAEEHISRIFERFYRVDKDRSRDAGGTGLGLAIVKHIVEAHGSHVDVESTPGRGSTFSFALKC